MTKVMYPVELKVHENGNQTYEFTLACGRKTRRTIRLRSNPHVELVHPLGPLMHPFRKPLAKRVNCYCRVCLAGRK